MVQEVNKSLKKIKQHKMEAEIYAANMHVNVHFYFWIHSMSFNHSTEFFLYRPKTQNFCKYWIFVEEVLTQLWQRNVFLQYLILKVVLDVDILKCLQCCNIANYYEQICLLKPNITDTDLETCLHIGILLCQYLSRFSDWSV